MALLSSAPANPPGQDNPLTARQIYDQFFAEVPVIGKLDSSAQNMLLKLRISARKAQELTEKSEINSAEIELSDRPRIGDGVTYKQIEARAERIHDRINQSARLNAAQFRSLVGDICSAAYDRNLEVALADWVNSCG